MGKLTKIDGIKTKNVPTIKLIEYEDESKENNKKVLEDILVEMIVHYFKNK